MRIFTLSILFGITFLCLPKLTTCQTPNLGTTESFAVFTAVGAFNNDGNTVVTGDVGTNVGAFNAFPPGVVIGSIHVANPISAQAATDVDVLYSYLDGLICGMVLGVNLGNNQILTPNIYCIGAASVLNGNLVLDGEGDPNARFIFQIDGALSTATLASVTYINSASACNVYWQINGAFDLGEGSSFVGTIVANGAITLLEASSLQGRALTRAGAVDLHNNSITLPDPPVSPLITADGDLTFCEGDSVILSGNLDGIWNTGDMSFSITVFGSGDYFVDNSNDCGIALSNIISVSVVPDNTPPMITCPSDLSIQCNESSLPANTGFATAMDDCDPAPAITFSDLIIPGICSYNEEILRTWVALDISGNDTFCIQSITISDLTGPVISCPGDMTLECTDPTDPGTAGMATATDNCSPSPVLSYSDVTAPGLCVDAFQIIRTWTATDDCANSSMCDQLIDVMDNILPTISCPSAIAISCTDSMDPATTGDPTATDNCDGNPEISFTDIVTPSGQCPQNYTINRTWTAMDNCSNSSQCIQQITVSDLTQPIITCPADVNVDCAASILPAATGFATATDDCDVNPGVDYSDANVPGNCPGLMDINRTWTTTDACGNLDMCVQIISISDLIDPVITCPIDVTLACTDPIDPGATGMATATDNCSLSPVISFADMVTPSGLCPQNYTINRTWTAVDDCSNSSQCIQQISVIDLTQPIITCPADLTVDCAASILPAATGFATATDDCDVNPGVDYSDANVPGSCPGLMDINRTWTATDACGNLDMCLQIITISDLIAPAITCPIDVTLACTDPTDPGATGMATATDNCSLNPVISFADMVTPSGLCSQNYTINRTWTAMDNCSNSGQCIQQITVSDLTQPIITCPADVNVDCAASILPAATGFATATDDCDVNPGVDYSDANVPGNCPGLMDINRTWTATDACGNLDMCVQIISISDLIDPVITCPMDVTLACTDPTDPGATGMATATDNCSLNPVISFADMVTPSGLCPQNYTINRTWTAMDNCSNSGQCMQQITVSDLTQPIITCPADVNVDCAASILPAATGFATATDDCDVNPGVDYSDANVPGSCPGLMDINRTWTATDACGNLDMCLQIITISDLIGPAITCPMDVTLACTDPTDPGATGMATATDNCSLNPVISFADIVTPSGLCPQNYTISRTWTAVDDCSNSNQCMQQITVIDLTPPIITCPADLTVDCAASILPAATGFATATDDCDVNLGVDYSDANVPGNCPGLMDINRTWTATDACGNADECLQIIYQIDDSAPVIICPQDLSLSCAIDIPPANIDSVVATDNCGIPLIIFLADQTINLTCLNRFTLLRVYQATDDCNNSASCTQTITINDVLPPILICPASIVVDCALDVPMPDPSLLTVTDNCGGQSTVLHVDDLISNFVCANQYLIRRNYQAIDECENIATCVQEIEVLDLVGPSITCLPAITVACAGDVPLVDLAQIITSDNCGGIVVVTLTSEIMTGQTCENNFALTQTYQATDECGNVNVCTRIITVLDNIPPVITCPGTVSVACADQVPPENISLVVSSDNCGVASVTLQSEFVSNQTCENRFLLTRIYLAEDDCGNTNTCSQVFDVSDILPPTIVFIEPLLAGLLDGDTLNLQCYGQDPQWKIPTFSTSSIQADDICSGEVSVTYEKTLLREGNCIDDGYINLYRLSWTATDICGNSSSAHLILKLVDTISPTIQGIPDDITINCDALLPQPVVVTAFDECLCACVVVTNQSVPQPGCQNGMIIPITWTAIDQCGNVTIETQNITLVDTIGPAITMVHPDIVGLLSGTVMEVECNEDGFPRFVHEMDIESVFGTSECGGEALIVELDTAIIVSSNCATSGFLEERTFLWTVTDLCGNSSTFSFSVRMIDTIPPKWIGVPDTVCFGSPLLMDIEAIDNCDYPYTQITDKTIANPCGSGTAIRRRYDAFDECGNHSVVSAVILPSILNVPVIKFINQDLLDMLPGNVINTRCNINNGNYTSFGVEDIYVEGVCSDLASTSFAEHVLELRDCTIDSVKAIVALVWTVTDICGNTASRSIVATIVDNEPPSFDHFDAEVSIGCSDFLPVVQAVDNCGSVTITLQDTILETSCIYEYTILRLVTATDECGTYTSREQIIHVGGGTGIIFTGIDSVLCDPVDVPVVTAFDPCAELFVDVVMTVDTLDVLCNDGWVLIRTWTAVDVCGNVSTMTQRVIINDHTVPVITVPSYSVLFPFWTHQDSIVYLWQFELLKKLYDLDKNSVVVLDDCDEYIDVEFSKDVIYSADCTVDGYYERWILTWVATDICGNSTSIQVTIDIVDDISPQFLMFPADITIYCEPLPEVPVLEAVDYSPVSIVFTESIEPGLEFGVTIVTRIWTATDVCGNSIQQIQTITWIPDNLLECEIILPEVVECNTHGIFIHSAITGGGGVASYDWKIVGEKCFIQGGQGTPWLKIYVGWAPVKIILTVTDSAGCVSMCMTTMSCILAQTVDGENLDPLIDPATAAHQKLLDKHPLDDGEISEMNMWPNPASGSVNLAFMSTGEVQYTVNISNMFGQTVSGAVMTSLDGLNTKRIDLSQLIDGNYRIQIVTQHRIYTENLIVLSK